MSITCRSIGCSNYAHDGQDFCAPCRNKEHLHQDSAAQTLSDRYPDQYKSVGDMAEIDTHAVHHLFEMQDHSGCLQLASHLLLMTHNSEAMYSDITKARDLLTRWLQLNQDLNV